VVFILENNMEELTINIKKRFKDEGGSSFTLENIPKQSVKDRK